MRLIFFFILSILFSCDLSPDLKKDRPNNLIPEEMFVLILEDLMVLEHQIHTDYPQLIHFKSIIEKNSTVLFKKYGINQSQFDSSFEYYASDQVKLKEIYSIVLENMTKKMTNLELKDKTQ